MSSAGASLATESKTVDTNIIIKDIQKTATAFFTEWCEMERLKIVIL